MRIKRLLAALAYALTYALLDTVIGEECGGCHRYLEWMAEPLTGLYRALKPGDRPGRKRRRKSRKPR